jgi:hypothetical protein
VALRKVRLMREHAHPEEARPRPRGGARWLLLVGGLAFALGVLADRLLPWLLSLLR